MAHRTKKSGHEHSMIQKQSKKNLNDSKGKANKKQHEIHKNWYLPRHHEHQPDRSGCIFILKYNSSLYQNIRHLSLA